MLSVISTNKLLQITNKNGKVNYATFCKLYLIDPTYLFMQETYNLH